MFISAFLPIYAESTINITKGIGHLANLSRSYKMEVKLDKSHRNPAAEKMSRKQ